MDDLVQWLRAQLDLDERIARAASGATVVGAPGAWQAAPLGDEWEASSGEDEELLVAVRPGLPRPPDVMSGLWGAVFSHRQDEADPEADSPRRAFEHAARHDPARVLREVDAKRQVLKMADEAAEQAKSPDYLVNGPAKMMLACLKPVVMRLAAVYSGNAGYRKEWRP